jgi:hypothetical protein
VVVVVPSDTVTLLLLQFAVQFEVELAELAALAGLTATVLRVRAARIAMLRIIFENIIECGHLFLFVWVN